MEVCEIPHINTEDFQFMSAATARPRSVITL